MKEALDDVKLNLVKAQARMKTQVDKIRRVEEWNVGDRVSSAPSTCELLHGICRKS